MEKEHSQYLRESQRNEDRSAIVDNVGNPLSQGTGQLDFQSLISGATLSATVSANSSTLNGLSTPMTPATNGTLAPKVTSWEDDVWGSILDGAEASFHTSLRRLPAHMCSL